MGGWWGLRGGEADVRFPSQDNDLKQYLDNCGNLMSVYNVKVRRCCPGPRSPASPHIWGARPECSPGSCRAGGGWIPLLSSVQRSYSSLTFFSLL